MHKLMPATRTTPWIYRLATANIHCWSRRWWIAQHQALWADCV